MSIHGSISRPQPPDIQRDITALDHRAKEASYEAARVAAAIVAEVAPGSLGGANLLKSARSVDGGYVVSVGIKKKARWRAVFPEGGTGIYGPTRKPIRRRKTRNGRPLPFVLPSGARVKEIPGQRAQHFMKLAHPRALAAVERVFEHAARR